MIYFLIGMFSGVISGMGIGGGTILIPALSILYNLPQQLIQGINLLYFIPTAIIALVSHIKDGNIEKKYLPKLIITGLIGALAGSFIAVLTAPDILRKIFAVFLLMMGFYEIFVAGGNKT